MCCQHMFVVVTDTESNMFPLRFWSQLASRSKRLETNYLAQLQKNIG